MQSSAGRCRNRALDREHYSVLFNSTGLYGFINPRRACAAKVTVVGFVCLSVCYATAHLWSVCLSWNWCHVLNGQWRSKHLGGYLWNLSIAEIQHSLFCTASVQCEGTHSLGIVGLKKANNMPRATWNTSQCDTTTYLSLSAALLSVSCLAIFCIRPITRNSLRLLSG